MRTTKTIVVSHSRDEFAIYEVKKNHGDKWVESYQLCYSELDHQIHAEYRGRPAASLVDNGNGVVAMFDGAEIMLNYSELEYLTVLLRELDRDAGVKRKYRRLTK
jgi:hypothetical protein